MGKQLQIEWSESIGELKQLYKAEKHPQRRTRLQVLWQLRQGKKLTTVADLVGVSYRVLQRWVAWYREGGLEEVLCRVTGHHAQGATPYLNACQQKALAGRVELGDFRTVWDVIEWVTARWGITYSYQGMYALMRRQGLNLKVPRPHSEKADAHQQTHWKKGG